MNETTTKKKTYILCPKCQARSKMISSGMGGYQTRECKNGHIFNYDKFTTNYNKVVSLINLA